MKLTSWTDYTLRVLMYCAAAQGREQPVTITEIAEAHGISRSHLTKIVMDLSAQGLLATTRGRGGGLRLQRPPEKILLAEVLRHTETDFAMVECFDRDHDRCRISSDCRLRGVLRRALDSFFESMSGVTLADLVQRPAQGLPRPVSVIR